MRNSSQKAGCILRFPASHSCHPRRVQWMSAAAAVCESPAASRADRTCSGAGFRAALPARLRFGWLGTVPDTDSVFRTRLIELFRCAMRATAVSDTTKMVFDFSRLALADAVDGPAMPLGFFPGNNEVDGFGIVEIIDPGRLICDFHFRLLPLFPRRGGLRCACHELNYTRIACNSKNFLQLFLGWHGHQAKPSNN